MPARTILTVALLISGIAAAFADEPAIRADLKAFFATDDIEARQRIVERIAADPDYDRARLSAWLHAADLFEPRRPGPDVIRVELPSGKRRQVTLRIPADYDHTRPYPLLYALHGSGGNGRQIIGYFERILGERIDEYIVAAPNSYEDLIIHHTTWPPTGEHPLVLRAIRRHVHVDADRTFVAGYSLGAHTSWTLAALYPDRFAGALPLAGTFTLMLPDLMWEAFIPNFEHIPILCVWGAGDTFYGGERISPEGGIAGVNRVLRDLLKEHEINATMIELPDADHHNVVPPADALATLLKQRRGHSPAKFEHTFRHVCQASAYWLEGHDWSGRQWTDKQETVRFRDGEDPFSDADFDQAAARTYRGLLGQLEGERDGQTLHIRRRKVREVTVWIHDDMIDWDKPVQLETGGRTRFDARLAPDLHVCLSQVARTWDFDRLRWAGLRYRSGRPAEPVTARTEFPTYESLFDTE
jgi:dienelactone hydrolase